MPNAESQGLGMCALLSEQPLEISSPFSHSFSRGYSAHQWIDCRETLDKQEVDWIVLASPSSKVNTIGGYLRALTRRVLFRSELQVIKIVHKEIFSHRQIFVTENDTPARSASRFGRRLRDEIDAMKPLSIVY